MADSIIVTCSVEHIDYDSFPMDINQRTDENGVIGKRASITSKFKSPLTGAISEITPLCKEEDGTHKVKAYKVSLNVPASVVSFNGLMENDVYHSCLFSLFFLQYWLLQRGVPAEVVKQIGLKHVKIESVDLTYLNKQKEWDFANECVKQIAQRGSALFNGNVIKQNKRVAAVNYWESDGNSYTKIRKGNKAEMIAYVKSGKTKNSFCGLPNDVAEQIFTITKKYVRFEVQLKKSWFTAADANWGADEGSDKSSSWSSPFSWKGKAGQAMYEQVFEEARELLRLNEKFNQRRHRQDFMQSLSDEHREILEQHYRGTPFDDLPFKSEDPKYRSKVKRAIQMHCHVDLYMSWEEQQSMPTLDWLFCPDMFKLKKSQKHLEPYSFVRPTIRQKLEAMKVLLLNLAKQQGPKSELEQERDKQTPEHGERFQPGRDEDGPSGDLIGGI
ncbi:hypothetical protein [Comamonas testosteroni]|nr:hypothetical protein [Comamonas testosteroni]